MYNMSRKKTSWPENIQQDIDKYMKTKNMFHVCRYVTDTTMECYNSLTRWLHLNWMLDKSSNAFKLINSVGTYSIVPVNEGTQTQVNWI